ncbi:hypothetical protein C6369_021295 [Rhodococcus rhodochrous]|uniref:hypothetical protein n=1 Tax=Rhodococcus rhodochrous TaxID=1829 RepID=UPI000D07B1CB|nr:hypothetical protein [Rhodococcus rhodochrous]AYA26723.1 hypothetical protein C6369_021295 [Rhodococcus rhodochrous]
MSTYRPRPKQARNKNAELGRKHKANRARMLAKLQPGEPCWWCGEGMYKEPESNPDGLALAADHEVARVNGGVKASRLLHGACNSQRGDGEHDHRRPTVTGRPFSRDEDPDERARWTLLDW